MQGPSFKDFEIIFLINLQNSRIPYGFLNTSFILVDPPHHHLISPQ